MRIFIVYLILTFTGPLIILLSGKIDFSADYRTANRESALLSPLPDKVKEAVLQVYSAPAFHWRGAFSDHVWVAIKGVGSKQYTTYQVIGWRILRQLPPLAIMEDVPDRYWFNSKPRLLLDIRGKRAEALIQKIKEEAPKYPYANRYVTWPGPNSNTFVAWLARQVPEMQLALPSNALGKDYTTQFIAKAPSGTGYQLSVFGLLGIMIAKVEGLEINFLGLVYGYSPYTNTLKLPGFGDIRLF